MSEVRNWASIEQQEVKENRPESRLISDCSHVANEGSLKDNQFFE